MSSARRAALLEDAHRLGEHRHEDAVDDEPGPVGRDDELLAELVGHLADGRLGRVARRRAADELDQRHDRHRAEEVHARRTARAAPARRPRRGCRSRSSSCSRRRSSSSGARSSRRRHSSRLTSTSSNTASIDEVGRAGEVEVVRRDDPPDDRVALVRIDLALGDGPIEVAGDPLATCLRAGEVRLVQDDVLADRGVDLADAVAHEPGAGDEDPFDRHRPQGTGRQAVRRRRRGAGPADEQPGRADARRSRPRPGTSAG